jgi:hypothetical protein
MIRRIAMGLLNILLAACAPSAPDWVEGGLYAMEAEGGGYQVLKILKIDDGGVHVRLYSNRFEDVPESVDEDTLYMVGIDHGPDEELGIGHLPLSRQSFSSWGARFVQQSTVSPEELEGYEMWLDADGDYF